MVIPKLPCSLYLASTSIYKKDNFPHLPSVLECLLKVDLGLYFPKEREAPAQICEL